ncbi:ribonuclease HII [bacterium BMS3Abin07]|nr:ribonuclease HII [bacterium BMS3Abin07]GBE32578.1 ribonuclease HII [bacterium BMS3Bbin05]HDO22506.1 ribonuclease HII [Nitrospirota bacterium]HDZ88853.1 ribonuclease HII [Nitrospirota bacterium]
MSDIFLFDSRIRAEGFDIIAGIDEAGRGPLAGPVVASAVILGENDIIPGVKDSKKLTRKRIKSLFRDIVSKSVSIGVGIIDSTEIDKVNILNATKKAMTAAVKDLSVTPRLLLIDALTLENCDIAQKSLIKGDNRSASIAAASIIAKYVRDSIMQHYHTLYPVYGFDKHNGYGTKLHMEKINEYGPCPIHRRSFSPVMSLSLPYGDA